jgi:hypothetical protein
VSSTDYVDRLPSRSIKEILEGELVDRVKRRAGHRQWDGVIAQDNRNNQWIESVYEWVKSSGGAERHV